MAELNNRNEWPWNKMIDFCVYKIDFQFDNLSIIKSKHQNCSMIIIYSYTYISNNHVFSSNFYLKLFFL